MRETDTHIYFYKNYLSNFHACSFTDFNGVEYKNTEQAFMAYKALCFNDHDSAAKIVATQHPRDAKKLGRLVENYNEELWREVRFGYMVYVNYLKYLQNSELKEKLLSTGDKVLVEASPIDNVWGVGLDEKDDRILDPAYWTGENLLGRVLMVVRWRLSEEASP